MAQSPLTDRATARRAALRRAVMHASAPSPRHDGPALPAHDPIGLLQHLQRTAGNQAVNALLQRQGFVQRDDTHHSPHPKSKSPAHPKDAGLAGAWDQTVLTPVAVALKAVAKGPKHYKQALAAVEQAMHGYMAVVSKPAGTRSMDVLERPIDLEEALSAVHHELSTALGTPFTDRGDPGLSSMWWGGMGVSTLGEMATNVQDLLLKRARKKAQAGTGAGHKSPQDDPAVVLWRVDVVEALQDAERDQTNAARLSARLSEVEQQLGGLVKDEGVSEIGTVMRNLSKELHVTLTAAQWKAHVKPKAATISADLKAVQVLAKQVEGVLQATDKGRVYIPGD